MMGHRQRGSCYLTRYPRHFFWGPSYQKPVIPSHTSAVSRAAVARPPNGGDADPEGRSGRARNDLPPRRQRRRVPHQSPSLNERGRKTERSREGSVTVLSNMGSLPRDGAYPRRERRGIAPVQRIMTFGYLPGTVCTYGMITAITHGLTTLCRINDGWQKHISDSEVPRGQPRSFTVLGPHRTRRRI
jgi:hypothetical protein